MASWLSHRVLTAEVISSHGMWYGVSIDSHGVHARCDEMSKYGPLVACTDSARLCLLLWAVLMNLPPLVVQSGS